MVIFDMMTRAPSLLEEDTLKSISIYEYISIYDSIATVGETGVWLRADFQSGSRVLKKVF